MTTRVSTLLATVLVLAAPSLCSQYFPLEPGRPVPSSSDNVPVIMKAVFGSLTHQFARAGRDTTSRVVTISFPTDSVEIWQPYRAFLIHALRGRDATETDTTRLHITVHSPTMRGDTLVVDFRIGGTWRCGSEWWGSSTTYQLNAVRLQYRWAPPYVAAYEFGDSGTCEK